MALVPNLKGAQRALQAGADEINLGLSASQTHNRANMRMSCEQSLSDFEDPPTGHPNSSTGFANGAGIRSDIAFP